MGEKYKIAVASKYGKLVDLHFGHASSFAIYEGGEDGFALVEERQVGQYCSGIEDDPRREGILASFQDCRAMLVLRIGYAPQKKLEEDGCLVIEWCDTVDSGLDHALEKLKEERR